MDRLAARGLQGEEAGAHPLDLTLKPPSVLVMDGGFLYSKGGSMVRLGVKDKRVIEAFIRHEHADGPKLWTDGHRHTTTILNRALKARDRFRLYHEPGHGMGGYGDSPDSPQHDYGVVAGVDRGNGYQSYQSIKSTLTETGVPAEAKRNLRRLLRAKGYGAWLRAHGGEE